MKDTENLKIYEDIGKKLRIKKKPPHNTEDR